MNYDAISRTHFAYNNATAQAHLSPVKRWGVYSNNSTFNYYWDYGFNAGGENPDPAKLPEGGAGGSNNHLYYPYGSTSRTNNFYYSSSGLRIARNTDGGGSYGRVRYNVYGHYSNYGTRPASENRLLIAFEESTIGNSIYFADHGLSTGDIAQLTTSTGSLPAGLSAATDVTITKIDDNRVKFANFASGVAINLTDGGDSAAVFSFTSKQMNLNHDTITITGNALNNGDAVTYLNNGASNIPGLVGGTSYFVFEKTTDRIKLATTVTGFDPAIDITVDTRITSGNRKSNYNQQPNTVVGRKCFNKWKCGQNISNIRCN